MNREHLFFWLLLCGAGILVFLLGFYAGILCCADNLLSELDQQLRERYDKVTAALRPR